MLNTFTDGNEGISIPVSTNMVKVMTLLAMQPMVSGMNLEEKVNKFEYDMVEWKYTFFKVFYDYPLFLATYAVFFVFIGVVLGYYVNKELYNTRMVQMMNWAIREIRRFRRLRHPVTLVDDWDPIAQQICQYRVLRGPEEADSGEEYFKETEIGLARYVKPVRWVHRRLNVEEMDPLEFSMLDFTEGAEEEEPFVHDAEVQAGTGELVPATSSLPSSSFALRPNPEPEVPTEPVILPGSPSGEPDDDELPEVPRVGLDWHDLDVLMEHLPRGQRRRAERIREVSLFADQSLTEYLIMHMSILYPGQPDLNHDFPLYWNRDQQHEYRVFQEIVVDGKYQDGWGSFVEQWFIRTDPAYPRRYVDD